MADTQKHKTVQLRRPHHPDPVSFINAATADNEETDTLKSNNVKKESRINVNTLKHEEVKEVKKKDVDKTFYDGKVRFTVYLPQELYLDWKKYELEKIISGKKVSMQEIFIDHIRKLLKK